MASARTCQRLLPLATSSLGTPRMQVPWLSMAPRQHGCQVLSNWDPASE